MIWEGCCQNACVYWSGGGDSLAEWEDEGCGIRACVCVYVGACASARLCGGDGRKINRGTSAKSAAAVLLQGTYSQPPAFRFMGEIHTDKQKNTHTDMQTYKQTDRHTDIPLSHH
jgi:hypothetical protein